MRRQLSPATTRLRQSRSPSARLHAGLATALWAPLALASCGTADPELAPAPPCPAATLLSGAERTSAYRAGADARQEDLRYVAALTNLASTCRYYEDGTKRGVDVDLTFDLIAERGPALSGVEELTYFVATVGPGSEVRSEHVLLGDLAFAGGEQRTGWTEELTLRLPTLTPDQAANYTLYVGFKLDDAELERRQQAPALR